MFDYEIVNLEREREGDTERERERERERESNFKNFFILLQTLQTI